MEPSRRKRKQEPKQEPYSPPPSQDHGGSSPPTTTCRFSIKLLIDKKGQRVLFGEAGKEFVDFLFDIFRLPLSTILSPCPLKKLKTSLGKLDGSYLQKKVDQEQVLNPETEPPSSTTASLLGLDNDNAALYMCSEAIGTGSLCCSSMAESKNSICNGCSRPMDKMVRFIRVPKKGVVGNQHRKTASYLPMYVYKCEFGGDHYYDDSSDDDDSSSDDDDVINVAESKDCRCPACGALMDTKISLVRRKREGYVKKENKFMVMDDLEVKPNNSTFSGSVTLLSSMNVKDLSALEEKVVSFGRDEALKLVSASLLTDKVLTAVFLRK